MALFISDINRELIHTYINIRDNPDELIGALSVLKAEYVPVSSWERLLRIAAIVTAQSEIQSRHILPLHFTLLSRFSLVGIYRISF